MRLDALASDLVSGWRQLNKHRAASVAAILSLGLAIGATSAAFRLVDAVLLRPLPVSDPDRLFVVTTTFIDSEQRPDYRDDFDYPTYRAYSNAVAGHADLMVVGAAFRNPIRLDRDGGAEFAVRQFVSGNTFPSLGLRPALGRLFTADDDVTPGAHPIAVVSYDFWARRLGRDPDAIGRTVHIGTRTYDIVGVAPEGFTGTEPGSLTDVYIPATMNVEALNRPGWSWFRIWLRPRPGIPPHQVREMLQASIPRNEVRLLPAGSGVSGTQKTFRRPLFILATLAALVLLVACGNVANLLIAGAMAREREMAVRLSIGATRRRLIQLVLTESALLAIAASGLGALFASWSAPLVVSMISRADRPVQLILDTDWRALGFGVTLAITITVLSGLAPALRASSVRPLGALKARENPRAQGRLTSVLTAAQMAFCVFLLFAAGLFVRTFERLVHQPLGFTHENVLLLPAESRRTHPPEVWTQLAEHLRETAGVQAVAVAGWAPLTGNRWRASVHVDGRAAATNSPYFLDVSPAYFATLRIPMIQGRDFRGGDPSPRTNEREPPRDGVGIVNEAFARAYFDGANPIGRRVRVRQNKKLDSAMEIIGLVRDAAYDNVREPMRPTVYVPLEQRGDATLLVRTASDPVALAAGLRQAVSRAQPDVRVRATEPLTNFVRAQMIRERLLATLSAFFAAVALLLAAIGLYGVLNHRVLRQQREIGIRMALGARASHVVTDVMARMVVVVCAGSVAGVAAGFVFVRLFEALLFKVRPSDPASVAAPIVALAAAAALAALPAAIRAVRIDPAQMLRTE